MRIARFAETPKRGQAYIYLDDVKPGIESPHLLIAKIKVHGVKRDPTPACASGFTCSDGFSNPFEYGHVMSWEMGGPNEVENIVPMYGRWQGNATAKGATSRSWRDMEVAIKGLARGKPNQFIYIAVVYYKASGITYESQSQNFSNWKQLFNWEESRIPTGFDVFVESVDTTFGKLLVKQFLDPAGPGLNADAERNKLLGGFYSGTPVHRETWDHSKLPPQDWDYLLRNMSAMAADRSFEQHNLDRLTEIAANTALLEGMTVEHGEDAMDSQLIAQWAEMPLNLPRNTDMYNFINEHSASIQKTLIKQFACEKKVAKAVTTFTFLRASFHGNPLKQNVKVWTKEWESKKAARKAALEKARHDIRFRRFEKNRLAAIKK